MNAILSFGFRNCYDDSRRHVARMNVKLNDSHKSEGEAIYKLAKILL